MNSINLFALLLLSLQSTTHAAQESSDFVKASTDLRRPDKKVQNGAEQNRQEIINQSVKNFPNLVEGFKILQGKSLIDQSFHDFLESKLSYDEDEEQESNFAEVITDATDLVVAKMKKLFLTTINTSMPIKNIKTTKIYDPVLLYMIKYKDGFMRLPIKQWINEKNNDNETLLHQAARNRSAKVIHILIAVDSSLDLNLKNGNYTTPLFLIASDNNAQAARMLITAGANPNISCSGQSPLNLAARFNNKEVAKILIAAGADLNHQNRHGETPLYEAVFGNHVEITRMLINAGANLNLQNYCGWTPLHWAALNNHTKIACILIAAGADLSIKSNMLYTAEQSITEPTMRIIFAQARRKKASSCTIS